MYKLIWTYSIVLHENLSLIEISFQLRFNIYDLGIPERSDPTEQAVVTVTVIRNNPPFFQGNGQAVTINEDVGIGHTVASFIYGDPDVVMKYVHFMFLYKIYVCYI